VRGFEPLASSVRDLYWGLRAWNCGLLRSVTAGDKCLLSAPAWGQQPVRLLHRLSGAFPTLTTAGCCPTAAGAGNGMRSATGGANNGKMRALG
jgi:hypothetical protein